MIEKSYKELTGFGLNKKESIRYNNKKIMTKHAREIIEKMKTSVYSELSFDFAFKLTNESDRGAILIGASKVESYLETLIKKNLPKKTNNYTGRLLNYPGPLSSFSGKIELCFAFRIFDEKVYDSLNLLRKIRNNAAHSDQVFNLKNQSAELNEIYNFEDGFSEVVHEISFNNLLNWKRNKAKNILLENNIMDIDFEKLWKERLPNPELDETFQEHLITWKLAHGLTLLCLKIEVIHDEWEIRLKSN